MRHPLLLAALLSGTVLLAASSDAGPRAVAASQAATPLAPEPQFALAQQLLMKFLSEYHYARQPLDDALSARVLDAYVEALDPSRNYLLAADIAAFDARYRTRLDDAMRAHDLSPAYAVYDVYRQRLEQRLAHVMTLLDKQPDFTLQEQFVFDREDAPWAKAPAELDELWRQRIKNDLISLMLTGKDWAESRDVVRKRYESLLRRARQVNSSDVFDTFLNAYAQTLDPHTSYFSPRDADEFAIRMSLSYEGIGAALQTQDEYVTVARILPGGSAEKTGLVAVKDRIVAVGQGPDGELVDVVGWRLDEVVELIRGPKDSVVRLQVLPGDAAPGGPDKLVALTRSEIKLEEQAAKQEIVEVKRGKQTLHIGVIKVPAFYMDFRARQAGETDYRSTTRDVRKLVAELQAAKVDGIVMDLRDNGGGSLNEAAELTGLFIDQGPVVQLRSSNGKVEVMDDPEPGIAYTGPLAVLVNRFSASASEIFAGAIQDYGRGVVVGTTTYGKGTIQNLVDLDRFLPGRDDLGQIKLTIGKFYRVTGSSTQHRGVVPDVELPSPIDPAEFGESAQATALPWDQIDSAGAVLGRVAPKLVPALSRQHERRAASDAEYTSYLADLADVKEARARKSVSLNLEARRTEREMERKAQLARENVRRRARGLAPLESLEDQEDALAEGRDVLLQESAEILVDALTLTGGNLAQVSSKALSRLN
jgi:carboxyl-terminal processing protease